MRAAALLPSTAQRLAVANLEQSSSNEHNDNDDDEENHDVDEKKNTSEKTGQTMDTLDDDTAEPIDWNTSGQSGAVSKEKQADADEVYGNFKALVDKDDDDNTDDVYASVSAAEQTEETKDDEDTSSRGGIESKPRDDYDSMTDLQAPPLPESLQAPPLSESLQAPPLSESLQASPLSESSHAPPLPPLSVSGVAALNQMWSTLEIDINNVDVSFSLLRVCVLFCSLDIFSI